MACKLQIIQERLAEIANTPAGKMSGNKAKIDKALELVNAAISARKAPEVSADDNRLRNIISALIDQQKEIAAKAKWKTKEKDYSKLIAPEFAKLPKADGKKRLIYAGIGSSTDTDKEIQAKQNAIGTKLEAAGYTLRSGGAIGADAAFEGINQDNGVDYTNGIKILISKVAKYKDLLTTDKEKGINTQRTEKINGKIEYLPFGNPFSQYTVMTKDDYVLSAMFYDWVVNNGIPATYLQGVKNREKRLELLNESRKKIIKSLKDIAGKQLYYEGTAKGKDLSHALVLAYIADRSVNGSLTISAYKEQMLHTATSTIHPIEKKEIFYSTDANDITRAIAKEIHPKENLGSRAKDGLDLHARNTFQIFGKTLDTPVDFVLFYAEETDGIRPKGGTGQAIAMARLKGIPTINMKDSDWKDQLDSVRGNIWVEPEKYRKVRESFEKANKISSSTNSSSDNKAGNAGTKQTTTIITAQTNERINKLSGTMSLKDLVTRSNKIVEDIENCEG